jgi:pimeloyl-ACP methyl ester carboxylesterase
MSTVISRDGTSIAYEMRGMGSPLILVDGAFGSRTFGPMPPLALLLADSFTVFSYDRRGRNESGDTPPYTVSREIEDLAALLDVAGEPAFVYGISSGGTLALEAAVAGLPIRKLAVYEPPYGAEAGQPPPRNAAEQLNRMISSGHRGDAVRFFLTRMAGLPADQVDRLKEAPVWGFFKAVAHTLSYDVTIMGDGTVPTRRLITIGISVLVMSGGDTAPVLQKAARGVADVLPHGQFRILKDQTHDVAPEALAPVLVEFFLGARRDPRDQQGAPEHPGGGKHTVTEPNFSRTDSPARTG